MSILFEQARDSSRPWRTSGPSPDPSIPAETSDGTVERRRAQPEYPTVSMQARRLLDSEIRYISHPSFDDPDARNAILAPMPASAVTEVARGPRTTAEFPPYL